jgi:hypothetical protein
LTSSPAGRTSPEVRQTAVWCLLQRAWHLTSWMEWTPGPWSSCPHLLTCY